MITIYAIDGSTGNATLLKTLDGSVVEPLLTTLAQSPSSSSNAFGTVVTWTGKAAPGVLLALRVTNGNAAQRYLQVHNLTAAPAAGAVPFKSYLIPAGTAAAPGVLSLANDFFLHGGLVLSTGITFAISTTYGTYTAATAADHTADAHHV